MLEKEKTRRLYIVCYHLPVNLVKVEGKWSATWAESLIARTEGSVANEYQTSWMGTVTPEGVGSEELTALDRKEIIACLEPMHCVPLFSRHADKAYRGYCKRLCRE